MFINKHTVTNTVTLVSKELLFGWLTAQDPKMCRITFKMFTQECLWEKRQQQKKRSTLAFRPFPFPGSPAKHFISPSTGWLRKKTILKFCQWLKEELGTLRPHNKWAKKASGGPLRPSKSQFQLSYQMTHFLIGPSIIVMGIGCMQLNLSYIFVSGRGEELMGTRGWY